MAPAGLGSDTGGSIRVPAALNGIVGFRPTLGRYPQAGIAPISHTRDTAGVMARTVDDVVLFDGVITGQATTTEPAALAALRLGVPAAFTKDVDRETAALIEAALHRLEAAGVILVPLDLSDVMDLNAKVSFPVALWEMKRDFEAYLEAYGAPAGIHDVAAAVASPDVKALLGTMVLGEKAVSDADYAQAIERYRPQLKLAYGRAFEEAQVEVLAFPTTPLPAQPIASSDDTVLLNGERVSTLATFSRNTDPAGSAGLPGLSLPAGMTSDGLPVGLELDGPAHSDRRLLAIGLAVERVLGPLPPP